MIYTGADGQESRSPLSSTSGNVECKQTLKDTSSWNSGAQGYALKPGFQLVGGLPYSQDPCQWPLGLITLPSLFSSCDVKLAWLLYPRWAVPLNWRVSQEAKSTGKSTERRTEEAQQGVKAQGHMALQCPSHPGQTGRISPTPALPSKVTFQFELAYSGLSSPCSVLSP